MGNSSILSVTVFLFLLNLLVYQTDGSGITLRNFCQLYGKGGVADPEPSQTLNMCRTRCKSSSDCVETIFISIFDCCLKYDHIDTYSFACRHLARFPSSGCKRDLGDPDLPSLFKAFTRPTRKTTPRITTTTTTTTTPTPAAAADGDDDATTASSMTTEADDGGGDFVEEGIPDPEFPELCEERVVTGYGKPWSELMTMLKNESAHYFCHKACKAPPRPKYYWLKSYFGSQETEAPSDCKAWGHYDSSLCASFLENAFKQARTTSEQQFVLTVCTLPPPEETTASSVTEA